MTRVAILICSCDYYSDCWNPILYSFQKYWPECGYDKLIVSNHKDANYPDAKVIKVGDHKGWASDTLKAIEATDYDYYIYFQEDYWLNQRVNDAAIQHHVQHCVENGIDYLKIQRDYPNRDNLQIGSSCYCFNPIDIKYSINTAAAIWKRDLFKKVLIPGFTGWDFEYKIVGYIKRNHISIKSEVIHSSLINTQGVSFIPANGVQRGKWTPAGVAFLKENGFDYLIANRKSQNKFYSWCYNFLPGKGLLKYPKRLFLRFLRWLNIN